MKTPGPNRCLLNATIALVAVALPLAGNAQDAAPVDEAPAPVQRYVSDKLVLNVYAEPESGSARVATIQTGDAVEELERSGNQVRVRLEDGREGWVGASYLTSTAPAAVRLRELERQQKTPTREPGKELTEETARLKKENSALQARVKELQSSLATASAAAAAARQDAQMTPTSAVEMSDEEADHAGATPIGGAWWEWLIAVVLAGGLGYASGYQALARRLRKKFGGLKIY